MNLPVILALRYNFSHQKIIILNQKIMSISRLLQKTHEGFYDQEEKMDRENVFFSSWLLVM